MDYRVHGIIQTRILEWVAFPFSRGSSQSGVGSLSLLQEIFPTQGSNPCLPHCRRILYQLSHKGSPQGKPKARRRDMIILYRIRVRKNHSGKMIFGFNFLGTKEIVVVVV